MLNTITNKNDSAFVAAKYTCQAVPSHESFIGLNGVKFLELASLSIGGKSVQIVLCPNCMAQLTHGSIKSQKQVVAQFAQNNPHTITPEMISDDIEMVTA